MTDEEMMREALEILGDARCKLTDPTLRAQWSVRKVRLIRQLRERMEK